MIRPAEVIKLEGERPVSWNKYYAGRTGWQRQEESHRVADLMAVTCPSGPMFECPVNILVEVGFDKRPYDPDNICVKGYIDGLKGRLIANDTIKEVKSITIVASKTKEPYVMIFVSPWRIG